MEFGPFGVAELLFIAILALVVFGPRKLPEMGHALGRALTRLRRGTADLRRTWEAELDEDSRREIAETARALREVKDDLTLAGREAWQQAGESARVTRTAASDVVRETRDAASEALRPPAGGSKPDGG